MTQLQLLTNTYMYVRDGALLVASSSHFYDCIRIALFVCETGFTTDARPSRESQAQALEDWHSHVRHWLRETAGDKAPDRRTTYRWIHPAPERRAEPRNHLKQIVTATQDFVRVKYRLNEDVLPRADHVLSLMCQRSLHDYIQLSGIQPFQLRELLPCLAELAQFMFPRTRTRLSYESSRTDLTNEVERHLSNTKFLVYRCRSIAETIYRGNLIFEREEGQTFICKWTDGDGNAMQGNAYVAEDAVCATVIAQLKGRTLNIAFLCIDLNGMKNADVEWGGIYAGLSDGGRHPCSGKMIVVPVSDSAFFSHKPTTIEKSYWGRAKYSHFLNLIRPTTDEYSGTKYAISITQTGIAASQVKGRLISKL
jgi:hypothetical protein